MMKVVAQFYDEIGHRCLILEDKDRLLTERCEKGTRILIDTDDPYVFFIDKDDIDGLIKDFVDFKRPYECTNKYQKYFDKIKRRRDE